MKSIVTIIAGMFLYTLSASTSVASVSTPTFNQTGFNKYGDVLERASKASGVPMIDIVTFVSIESNFNPRAKNIGGHSTASGLGGFVDNTWRALVRKHHRKYGLKANVSKTNAYASAVLTAEYIKENRAILEDGLNRKVSINEIRLAYFVGPGAALKVLRADPNKRITSVIRPSRGNGSYFYHKGKPVTVAKFRATIYKKVQAHRNMYTVAVNEHLLDQREDIIERIAKNKRMDTFVGSLAMNY